jgi:DNA-binding CsgD family transcriptional regulator
VDVLANGNIEQRERPIDTEIIERLDHRNYNEALAELIDDQRQRDIERLEQIRSTQLPAARLYAAGMLAWLSQRQIAKLTNHSQSTISQLIRTIK